MKANTKAIIGYLQQNPDADVTAKDLADILGLTDKQVNGSFTAAIQRKELGFRVVAERLNPETGRHQECKFLKLNDAGMAIDLDAEDDE